MQNLLAFVILLCAFTCVPTLLWAQDSCIYNPPTQGRPTALPSVDISVDDSNETVTISIYNHSQKLITMEDPLRGPGAPDSLGMKAKNESGPVTTPVYHGIDINDGFLSPAIVESRRSATMPELPHLITLVPDDHLSRTVPVSSVTWQEFLVPPEKSDTVFIKFRFTMVIDIQLVSCDTGWFQVHSRALLSPVGTK